MTKRKNNVQTTAFLVRDSVNRRYLNAPTYTGRRASAWGKFEDAHVFRTKAEAQSCASNINSRGPGNKVATVVPIEVLG